MPLLEAMNYGTAILASGIPAHREVAGDAATYCDPDDVDDIATKLEFLLNNPKRRDELTRRGSDQLQNYSWDVVAQDVHQQIRKAIKA